MVSDKRWLKMAAVLGVSIFWLAGCGKSTVKTQEGMNQIEALDYKGALALFEEAQSLGEDERLIARGQGIAHMGLTEYEDAIRCFKDALSLSSGFLEPMDYDISYYLAAAYTKSGKYGEAEQIYNAILDLKENELNAIFLRGLSRLSQAKYDDAKKDFDKVVDLDGKNYDRIIDIYEAMAHYGYEEAGREYLNDVIAAGSSSLSTFDQGRLYYYLGEYQDAALLLEKSREKGGAEISLYLGRAYEAIGEYNYAMNVYTSYIAKDTTNAEIYNQLGVCRMFTKDYQGALEAFQAGMKIENSGMMQTLAFNEIMAYEYLGEFRKAEVLLNSYMENYPDDAAAAREQVFLSTR